MALSAVLAAFNIMPRANLQLPVFKQPQHPNNGLIKCCKPDRPKVKGGGGGQTNNVKDKKMTPSDSRRISRAPAVKETQEKGKPKHDEGSSERSKA